MRVITKSKEESIGKILVQLNNLINDNTGKTVADVYGEMMAGIRDIAKHLDGTTERIFLRGAWEHDYMPFAYQRDETIIR